MIQKRSLGIDYGEKRIGIALSDPLGYTSQAFPFIPNTSHSISEIHKFCNENNVSIIILGLPLHLNGSESESSKKVRSFAKELEDTCQLPVKFWDERLSSMAVERHLIEANVSRKKRKTIIDSQAAAFILQGYLDQQRNKASDN